MNEEDLTQYQTDDGKSTSKKLSMQATTPPADVPGYRLQKFLGAGAFGQVWTGQDLNTGRSVAVKFFLHRSGVNWSLLSREVKNLVQMSADRNVVQVLGVGWESDPPYYIMELVPGGSLEDYLRDKGTLPQTEAVQMFRTICVGLNHCHSKGVLHCDLKPANVLLGDDNIPRLADFGQSRMTDDQTPALGTLFYMAPEQADLESTPDSSWDVYAVGAILFRMLTGRPPYKEESVVGQIDTAGSLPKRLERYREAIAESKPPSAYLKDTGIDRPLARIISRCLAVDPARRYANVQEILQDLDARENARARRPLMLLGILGPVLLLAASAIYAAKTIDSASVGTKQALSELAFTSSMMTAQSAARNLEYEIDRYFQLTRDEANREEVFDQLKRVLDDSSLTQIREDLASAGNSLAVQNEKADARERLLDHPARIQLDKILASRLKKYRSAPEGSRRPRLATMFVTDAYGTIISIAYDPPVARDRNSAGRNYAYRTYFHAGGDDLDRKTPIKDITPLAKTHLSSAFPSSATDLWKVAISTPLYFSDDRSRPDAVFVATINLGDFQLLQGAQSESLLAVLVEARDGPRRGTVLQHPMMESAKREKKGENYVVPDWLMDELEKGDDVDDYVDPLADIAPAYGGKWIAAMQPVSLPANSIDHEEDEIAQADLMVLVQYRLAKVLAPVGHLRSQLLWEGAIAAISVLVIILTLWYFVRRISDRPTQTTKSSFDTVNRDVTETAVAE